MIFYFLALSLSVFSSSVSDNVHMLRIETTPGTIELSTAVAISPNHAAALCMFTSENSVTVETESGILHPDSLIISPDLGIVIMQFDDQVFEEYEIPSSSIPEIGETLSIIGHGLSGIIAVDGAAREQYPDGSFLLTSDIIEGLMGAAVFNSNDEYVGIVTGIIRPERQFNDINARDFIVLYPTQIWYMWSKLAVLEEEIEGHSFGVTALSSISLTCSRPSGIHIVSVTVGSTAWDTGLRPGDLITHIDGTPVYHPETLRGMLLLSEDTLNVTVLRDTYERDILIPPF